MDAQCNFMYEFLSEKEFSPETLKEALMAWYRKSVIFASGKAKEAYDALDEDDKVLVIPTGTNGKVTIDDVRLVLGEEVKGKGTPSWASKVARELAEKNGLTPDSFSEDERTGELFKSTGKPKITLEDVKRKIGDNFGNFSSPGVAKLAREASVTEKDFPGMKVIRKADVQALIAHRKDASNSDCAKKSTAGA